MQIKLSAKNIEYIEKEASLERWQAVKAIKIHNDRFRNGVGDLMRGLNLGSNSARAGTINDILRRLEKRGLSTPQTFAGSN